MSMNKIALPSHTYAYAPDLYPPFGDDGPDAAEESDPFDEFIEGFAAGAELDRQTAYLAWLEHGTRLARQDNCRSPQSWINAAERQGRERGWKMGRHYIGKPTEVEPMTEEQHNRYPKGRWTP